MERVDKMSSQFKLYDVPKEELYGNKSPQEKEILRKEMVEMALERGYKPTARYYNTYPATVRRWVKVYQEQGWEGLKERRKKHV